MSEKIRKCTVCGTVIEGQEKYNKNIELNGHLCRKCHKIFTDLEADRNKGKSDAIIDIQKREYDSIMDTLEDSGLKDTFFKALDYLRTTYTTLPEVHLDDLSMSDDEYPMVARLYGVYKRRMIEMQIEACLGEDTPVLYVSVVYPYKQNLGVMGKLSKFYADGRVNHDKWITSSDEAKENEGHMLTVLTEPYMVDLADWETYLPDYKWY